MSEKINRDWKFADAVYNGKAFGMRTKSGDGRSWPDDLGATHFLPPNASNRALGAALRDSLEHTRLLNGDEFRSFFDKEEMKRNKQSWCYAMATNMQVKSYAVLSKQLGWVGVLMADGILHLQPTDNRYGRQSLYLPDRDVKNIHMPYASDDAAVGAALREAFKRCEGTGRADLTFDEPLPD